ncbi:DUF72 domain-containing protein [Acidobacteriota bacterium]
MICAQAMDTINIKNLDMFHFRDLNPHLFIGTTSDRYAGWIGQVYTAEHYEGRIKARTNRVGGEIFTEEVLPVDSVKEYFEHFPVLEIDFTFYRTLLDKSGNPTSNFHVLQNYQRYMNETDKVILKVPQIVFAKKIRKSKVYMENEDYLNADLFNRSFYEPAKSILGKSLAGMVFEQEYQRKDEASTAERLASELKGFFASVPQDDRYHVEIRTSRLLSSPLFEVLKEKGVGLVMSHWTWLPSLSEQFNRSNGAPFNSGESLVIRLLTPRGKAYSETYAAAHPFNALVDGMLHESTVRDTVNVVRAALRDGKWVYLLVNNRFGGNAPLVAFEIIQQWEKASHG